MEPELCERCRRTKAECGAEDVGYAKLILECRETEIAWREKEHARVLAQLARARQLLLNSVDAIDVFLAEEEGACGNERPGALESAGSSGNATTAATGGRSRPSTSRRPPTSAAGSPESAAPAASTDVWLRDDSNPFGHRVCRALHFGDLQIVLTVDEGSAEAIRAPEAELHWLLTGKSDE